jgi:hypothetical protein
MLADVGLALLLALSGVAAATRGGVRERKGLAVFAVVSAAWMLTPARLADAAAPFFLVLDFAALVLIGRLAWKSPRNWPVWAMAPQAVAVAASLAFMLQDDAGEQTYLRAVMMARYGAVLLLLIGACRRPVAQP